MTRRAESIPVPGLPLPTSQDRSGASGAERAGYAALSPSEAAAKFERIYCDRGWTGQWEQEREGIVAVLEAFLNNTNQVFGLVDPVGVGSTALILQIWDKRRSALLAAKLPRPRWERIGRLIEIIRTEADKLWTLDHPNVIRVHEYGTIAVGTGKTMNYYVMDYVDGTTASEHVRRSCSNPSDLLRIVNQVACGLDHIHSRGLVHCDIKPGNILIDGEGRAKIADLGFSKYIDPADAAATDEDTAVSFTLRYAHPELIELLREAQSRSEAVAVIPRGRLRPEFDLYSLGVSLEEMRKECHHGEGHVHDYADAYASLAVSRLLRGLNRGISPYPGFSWESIAEHGYRSAAEMAGDIDRAIGRRPVEFDVPELDDNHPEKINVPGEPSVALTPRVEALMDHPTLRRLNQVRQLGFIDYIYPGGKHSRLEHSLGTYAKACRYIRALYYDDNSPLFRSLVTLADMKAVLVAALLHDVGQYPLAHDLEEVDSDLFGHSKFSLDLILSEEPGGLAQVIQKEWGIGPSAVADILDPTRELRNGEGPPSGYKPSLVARLLSSIVDGPIDVDKVDYLYRDSLHCGVPYGLGMDSERLMRCLTTVLDPDRDIAAIGLMEKGRICAEVMGFVRYALYSSIYWHHAYRAVKAMMRFVINAAVRNVPLRGREGRRRFRRQFRDEVVLGRPGPARQLDLLRVDQGADEDLTLHRPPDEVHLLTWLRRVCPESACRMVACIERRELYKRAISISPGRSKPMFDKMKRVFDHSEESIEQFRSKIEQLLRDRLEATLASETSGIHGPEADSLRSLLDDETETLCLVDMPLEKASGGNSGSVWYVTESGRYPRSLLDESSIWKLFADGFNEGVSKFRLFVHPALREIVERELTSEDMENMLDRAYITLVQDGVIR